jgi:hypothetical protein
MFAEPDPYSDLAELLHISIAELKDQSRQNFDFITGRIKDVIDAKEFNLEKEKELWHETLKPIMDQIPDFMKNTFGDWEFVAAEYELFEPIIGEDGYFFKGYVDAIFKSGDHYWICDWKSSKDFWDSSKSKDPKKYMQLVLYKHFYAVKNNIPLDKIKCGFVVLRRKVTKNNQNRISFIPIEIDEVKLKEAEKLIHRFFLNIKKHFYTKDRESCRFCVYYNTTHCKG